MFSKMILYVLLVFSLPLRAELISSDSYIDFGDIEVGESEFIEVELINTYDFDITITDVFLDADFSIFDLNENCFGTLSSGDSCYLEVVFTPEEEDWYMGEIDIQSNQGDDFSIELFGEGAWDY